jgi:hypothetical protein
MRHSNRTALVCKNFMSLFYTEALMCAVSLYLVRIWGEIAADESRNMQGLRF